MSAAEKRVILRMCEFYASGDADAMADLFTEAGVYDNVPMCKPFEGREAVRAYLRQISRIVTVEIEILHMLSEGEWVLSERIDTHVLRGQRIPLPVMSTARVVGGKIALWRDYYCQKMVEDLGLVE